MNIDLHKTHKAMFWEGQGRDVVVRKNRKGLEEIEKVEALYWFLRERSKLFWEKEIQPVMKAIHEAGGRAHCKPLHKYEGDQNMWWLYSVSKWNGVSNAGRLVISFDWVDEPEDPINQELGQRYYDRERFFRTVSYRIGITVFVLKRLLEDWLFENPPKKIGTILRLILNEREYVYMGVANSHNVLVWEKLFWQEDETIIVRANDEVKNK